MPEEVDFVTSLGRPLLAHRLRRLSEALLSGYAQWLPQIGVSAPARTLSTLLLLDEAGPLGPTELAAGIRFSHPLMIGLIRNLEKDGLVAVTAVQRDRRRRRVGLTEKGRAQVLRVRHALAVLDRAFEDLFHETGTDMLAAITSLEAACTNESFSRRIERAASEVALRGVTE